MATVLGSYAWNMSTMTAATVIMKI